MDSSGLDSGQSKEIFFLLQSVQTSSAVQRASLNWSGRDFKLKRPPPTDVKVKNHWRYTSSSPHAVAMLVEALRYKPEVVGSIPDDVIGICHRHNPSGRNMALGSTHEFQEYFLGAKGGRCVGPTTLPPPWVDCLEFWDTQGFTLHGHFPMCLLAGVRDIFVFIMCSKPGHTLFY